MDGRNMTSEQQWWQQQWGGQQQQQHPQQSGRGAHAGGATGGGYGSGQPSGQAYANFYASAHMAGSGGPPGRHALQGDQRSLFMQAARPGQRSAVGGGGGGGGGGGKQHRRKGPAGISGVPLAAAGDYLEDYPAVKSLIQRFRWVGAAA